MTDPTKFGFVMLVLGDEPPIRVAQHGRVDIATAASNGLDRQGVTWRREQLADLVDERIAWITWHEIVDCVDGVLEDQQDGDESVHASLSRLVDSVSESVRRHS